MTTRDEDFIDHVFVASTHSYLLVFTEPRPGVLAQSL